MKVLAYIREDYKKNIGGDSIQFINTVEALRKKGIDVTVSSSLHNDLTPYDYIHIFNIIRIKDTYRFFKHSKNYKKKIILTPIYWDYGMHLYKNLNNSKFKTNWKINNALRKEVIKNVDLILPSSELELKKLKKEFNLNIPYKIVYNGVNSYFTKGNSEDFLKKYNINNKDFILSVGRICSHKNQLTLAKISKNIKVPLVLIGPINDFNYFNKCKDANPLLIHINELDHKELASAYKAAKVHCLISWYETPGLVNLEAGIAGCNILTTSEGSTKEYFKNYVEYSHWNNFDDILNKTTYLLNKEKDDYLKDYIMNNFLWENTASSIIEGYNFLSY